MGKLKDLTGQKFGRWTVIGRQGEYRQGSSWWYCDCDCGTKNVIVSGSNLKKGNSNSCGCYRKEFMSKQRKKYNVYDLMGDYGIGYTTKEEPFYFDLEDYKKIKSYCWFYGQYGYIQSNETMETCGTSERKYILMHRLIMNAAEGEGVDHIYHIKYDNRKTQLRIVTQSQNSMNALLSKGNMSGNKGVSMNKSNGQWIAIIGVNGKCIQKTCNTKEEAIAHRKFQEEKYFGEYNLKEIQQLNNIKEMN